MRKARKTAIFCCSDFCEVVHIVNFHMTILIVLDSGSDRSEVRPTVQHLLLPAGQSGQGEFAYRKILNRSAYYFITPTPF